MKVSKMAVFALVMMFMIFSAADAKFSLTKLKEKMRVQVSPFDSIGYTFAKILQPLIYNAACTNLLSLVVQSTDPNFNNYIVKCKEGAADELDKVYN
eukprot:403357038